MTYSITVRYESIFTGRIETVQWPTSYPTVEAAKQALATELECFEPDDLKWSDDRLSVTLVTDTINGDEDREDAITTYSIISGAGQ